MVAKGEGGGRGMNWESGFGRYKLLHLEWINNKVLLYSTGSYIQYPVINHNGKECEKEKKYIYVTESLCCTTQQCKSIILQLKRKKKKKNAEILVFLRIKLLYLFLTSASLVLFTS